MNKIKQFVISNWIFIGFIVTSITDISTGFLEALGLSTITIALIRLAGTIFLAIKTPTNLITIPKSVSANTDPVNPQKPSKKK